MNAVRNVVTAEMYPLAIAFKDLTVLIFFYYPVGFVSHFFVIFFKNYIHVFNICTKLLVKECGMVFLQ